MRILGIDPGLATVGIGVIEGSDRSVLRLLDFCTVETPAGLPLPARLRELSDDLAKLLREHAPDLVVVEKIYFATNRKTAIDVAQARGVILLTVEQQGITILEVTPLELKAAVTGDGSADKRQVRDMLRHILRLDPAFLAGEGDDATDALALAVYGAITKGGTDFSPCAPCPARAKARATFPQASI